VQTSIDEMKAVLERTSAESNAILIRQLEEANLESRGLRKQLQVSYNWGLQFYVLFCMSS
jgi:hypothetical protein